MVSSPVYFFYDIENVKISVYFFYDIENVKIYRLYYNIILAYTTTFVLQIGIMEILKLLTFISLFFMVSGGTDDDDTTNNDNTSEELPARQSKCSGCHKPSHTHIWGPPGPNCDGPPIIPPADTTKPSTRKRIRTVANPQSPAAENPLVVTGNPEEVLQQQLATLALEEQQLQNQMRDRDLQRQI